jgi:hypothetical protein
MGWQDDDVVGSHLSVKTQPTDLGHTVRMIPSSFNKGVASVLDAVLNTPTNLANIGVSGAGLTALALGSPETASKLAGYVTPQPNYARRTFEKIGAIENINPQSAGERIADIAAQGAGGALLGPSASLPALARTAGIGAASAGAGQGVTEATGSPLAGQLVGLAAPATLPTSESISKLVAALEARRKMNAARDAITTAGMEQGYVLPPSVNRPTALNRFLESISGKAATRQAVEVANQPVTNKLVREQLGLDPDAPITEAALDNLRDKLSEPYKKVAKIAPYREQVATNKIDPLTNQPVMESRKVDPKQMLFDLRQARSEASQYERAFLRDQQPATKQQAELYKAEATRLEKEIEAAAVKSGNPQLVNELREARKQIAQTYDVENALNIGTTNVSARDIGASLSKGKPLTGNLQMIGKFAEQNPLYTRETSEVSTPGVDALRTLGGTMVAASGHPGVALAAFLGAPTRALLLSKPYQRMFATPNYDPGMLAKALKNYTPFERDLIMAQMAARQSQERK